MSQEWKYTSLEMSKRLVELGVILQTCKGWYKGLGKWEIVNFIITKCMIQDGYCYPAIDIAELGRLLPEEIMINDYLCTLVIDKYGNHCWDVGYKQIRTDDKDKRTYYLINSGHESEIEARGSALIHLLEEKIVTAEEINSIKLV